MGCKSSKEGLPPVLNVEPIHQISNEPTHTFLPLKDEDYPSNVIFHSTAESRHLKHTGKLPLNSDHSIRASAFNFFQHYAIYLHKKEVEKICQSQWSVCKVVTISRDFGRFKKGDEMITEPY